MNISFVGFGNMAKALAQGLLVDKSNELRAAAPSLAEETQKNGIKTYSNNMAVIPKADILIIAVKPMHIDHVFTQIASALNPSCLVISIVTGVSLSWFAKQCPGIPMVRAMPNIAASIGQSATPMIANEWVTEQQKAWAKQLFTPVGLTLWVQNEVDLDAFTALSGSGPAYVFLFIEAMIKAATSLGLKESEAHTVALQTVHGAVNLAMTSKAELFELRKTVTSPAGTTAAAIEVFTQHHFNDLIYAAMEAAYKRAQELGTLHS